jgi:hypothetical protein
MTAEERLNMDALAMDESIIKNLKEQEEMLKEELQEDYVEKVVNEEVEETQKLEVPDTFKADEETEDNDEEESTKSFEELEKDRLEVKEMLDKVEANNFEYYSKLFKQYASKFNKLANIEGLSPEKKKEYLERSQVYIDRFIMVDNLLFSLKPILKYNDRYGKYKKEKYNRIFEAVVRKMDANKNIQFIDPRLMNIAVEEVFPNKDESNLLLMKIYMFLNVCSLKDPVESLYMYMLECVISSINNENFKRKDEVIENLKKLL